MKDKLGEKRRTFVAEATVPQQKLVKVAKLVYGVVSSKSCLASFLANKAYANIRHLNHSNIIAAIANGASDFVCATLDNLYDERFLGWGTAATDYGWRLACYLKKLLF